LDRIGIGEVEPKRRKIELSFKCGDVATFLPGKWPVATSIP
jgi:hypothetical protein